MNIQPTKNYISESLTQIFDEHAVTCKTIPMYFEDFSILIGDLQSYGCFGGIDYIIRKINGKKRFFCNYIPSCRSDYGKKSHIVRHIDVKHKDIRPFKCKICGYRAPNKSRMKEHINTHTGEKPFVCEECKVAYGSRASLRGHQLSHSDQYRFYCEYEDCKYGNNFKVNLKGHIRRKHTGEKPYVCECGNYAAADLSNFKLHKRIENGEKPYICQNCGYDTPAKSHLNRHLISESKEYPHVCDFCDWGTPSLKRLVDHINKHTKEVAYPCPECGKIFYSQHDVDYHKDKVSCIFPKYQWKEWEKLCINYIAPILYKDQEWEAQPKIDTPDAEQNWIEPELVIHNQNGTVDFVDAKRNPSSVSPKDLNVYPMYCDQVIFWVLYGKSKIIDYKDNTFIYVSSEDLMTRLSKSSDDEAKHVISLIRNLKTSRID